MFLVFDAGRFFKSSCGKLVEAVHGDDILLAGTRSFVDAVRKHLRTSY